MSKAVSFIGLFQPLVINFFSLFRLLISLCHCTRTIPGPGPAEVAMTPVSTSSDRRRLKPQLDIQPSPALACLGLCESFPPVMHAAAVDVNRMLPHVIIHSCGQWLSAYPAWGVSISHSSRKTKLSRLKRHGRIMIGDRWHYLQDFWLVVRLFQLPTAGS
ncbi:hypothetical protein F4820DRAFT_29048 [Hypoxylon rubiginosum]|uniref:Uncharacterized protein n=1 Tax=Hypoxylon rubiginosum TaxID=110542 RepID=A0ACB9ZD81_9PEZI|nr:hypothetical protein F4820DRAFT_29048 [Hypoxylon rubiginosum]